MDSNGTPLVVDSLYEFSGGNIKTPRVAKYTGPYDENGTIFYVFENQGGFTQKELTDASPYRIVKKANGMDSNGAPLVINALYELSGGNIKTPRVAKYTGPYDESGKIFHVFENQGGFTQKELTDATPYRIVKKVNGGRRKRRVTRRSKKNARKSRHRR